MTSRHWVLSGAFALLLAASPSGAAAGFTGLKTRIETPLMRESVAFYTDVIGLEVLSTWDEQGDRGAILGLGGSPGAQAFLEIAHVADGPPPAVSLQFRVDDLAAVETRLRGRWEYRGPEARPWGSTYLYLRDPAGVQVIIYEGEL